MENPHENLASIREVSAAPEEIDYDYDHDYDEELVLPYSSCGCLYGFYSRVFSRRDVGSRRYLLQQQQEDQVKENWFVENVKKVREFSEVLAGPKWKNFIRSCSTIYKKRKVQFHYDPQSYALNFDDGNVDRDVEGAAYLHFSKTAYAAPSGINNAKF